MLHIILQIDVLFFVFIFASVRGMGARDCKPIFTFSKNHYRVSIYDSCNALQQFYTNLTRSSQYFCWVGRTKCEVGKLPRR